MTWQEISHILDNEIKRNTEARIASQDLDLSNLKRKSDTQKDKDNGKEKSH